MSISNLETPNNIHLWSNSITPRESFFVYPTFAAQDFNLTSPTRIPMDGILVLPVSGSINTFFGTYTVPTSGNYHILADASLGITIAGTQNAFIGVSVIGSASGILDTSLVDQQFIGGISYTIPLHMQYYGPLSAGELIFYQVDTPDPKLNPATIHTIFGGASQGTKFYCCKM